MFKIEHPNQGDGVRGFKWKWWYDTDNAMPTPTRADKKEKIKRGVKV